MTGKTNDTTGTARPASAALDGRVAAVTGSSIPYAVSKAAVNRLTLLLATTLGPEIRVHAIAPGLIDIPWTSNWHAVRQAVCQTAPLRRAGTAQDVADTCLGLIQARYSTGQILLVDGGMALR